MDASEVFEPVTKGETALISRAALGDADAQGELVDMALKQAAASIAPLSQCAAIAEVMARMAASHGRREDQYRLVAALRLCSQAELSAGQLGRSLGYEAEALAILNELADAGDEEAADLIQLAGDALPPSVLHYAGQLRRRDEDGISWLSTEATTEQDER